MSTYTGFPGSSQITNGKPSSCGEIGIAFFGHICDGAPFLEGFLLIALPLKHDSGSNRLVYKGCFGILLDTFGSLAGLVRLLTDTLSVPLCFQERLSLVAHCLNLVDKVLGCFCISLGLRHILAGFDLESLKTKIASKHSANTDQRKDYGDGSEP